MGELIEVLGFIKVILAAGGTILLALWGQALAASLMLIILALTAYSFYYHEASR